MLLVGLFCLLLGGTLLILNISSWRILLKFGSLFKWKRLPSYDLDRWFDFLRSLIPLLQIEPRRRIAAFVSFVRRIIGGRGGTPARAVVGLDWELYHLLQPLDLLRGQVAKDPTKQIKKQISNHLLQCNKYQRSNLLRLITIEMLRLLPKQLWFCESITLLWKLVPHAWGS